MSPVRLAPVVIALLLLGGCATSGIYNTGAPSAPANPSAGASAGSAAGGRDETASGAGAELPAPAPNSAVTNALLVQSQDQRSAGNLGGAAATIERAITISPDDAVLWVELAEIRRDQGDRALAEEMARKALTLTGENSAVAARARRLLGR